MNTQIEIYVSYAWNARDESGEDGREHILDKFCEACEQRGYVVHRDKTAIGYRDSIEDFMRRVGAGKYVFAVVSAKYLFSEACMFEAVRMLAHERFEERVFPVVLPDADIFKSDKAFKYKTHWKKRLTAYSKKLDKDGRDSASTEWQLPERTYKEIHEHIGEFITRIKRLNVLSPSKHLADHFADLFEVLEKQIDKDKGTNRSSNVVISSHHVTTTPPVFQKLDLKKYTFDHALRPAQTKSLVVRLPDSMNIVAAPGQGRHRIMEDIESCGIQANGIRVVRLKLPETDYGYFLREVAAQASIEGSTLDLVELLRESTIRNQQPILFILENLDRMLADPPGLDARYDIGFLHKLNSLKNAAFAALIVSTYRPINHASFRGLSSPLWLDQVPLNSISYDDILGEVRRRLPTFPDDLATFIAEQLEYDPNETHEQLNNLIQTLEGRTKTSRDFIGQELKALRQKFGNYGRK